MKRSSPCPLTGDGRQEGGLKLIGSGEPLKRSLVGHVAIDEHADVVAGPGHLTQDVAGDDDGAALLGQGPQPLTQLDDALRVQAVAGLVQMRTCGSPSSAWARARRIFIPVEKVATRLLAASASPTCSSRGSITCVEVPAR